MPRYEPMQRGGGSQLNTAGLFFLLLCGGIAACLVYLSVVNKHTHTVGLDSASKTVLNGVKTVVSGSVDLDIGASIRMSDTSDLDAFKRLRTSSPLTLFASKEIDGPNTLAWTTLEVSGSGTSVVFNENQASHSISVSGTTAGHRVRQSKVRIPYLPGKSQLAFMTGVLGTGAVGITARIGMFDAQNGLFFQSHDGVTSVCQRSYTSGSAVDTCVAQSNWNIDVVDGTTSSNIVLDESDANIFLIDFQWLGSGRVRFGFDFGRTITYVHEFINPNTQNMVYMSTPSLPVRYEVLNDGSGPAYTLTQICSTIASEGGHPFADTMRVADRHITGLTTNTSQSIFPLVCLRMSPLHLNGFVRVNGAHLLGIGNTEYHWELVLNPTFVGTALSWLNISASAAQYAIPTVATTLTEDTGMLLASGYDAIDNKGGSKDLSGAVSFQIGHTIDGVSDVVCVGVVTLSATSATFYGSISFDEMI